MRPTLYFELWLRRAGWPAVAGILLLVAGAFAHAYWLPAQSQRITRLQAEYRRVIARVVAPAPKAEPVSSTPGVLLAQRQAAFNATLSPRAQAPALIKTVFAQAQKSGLVLSQAEYRLVPDKTGGFAAYQMTLPVKGPYLKLREFIDNVLVEVPSVALEDVSFKRDGIGAVAAEAKLRLVFFLKEPGA